MSANPHTKLVHHLLQLQREKVTGALTVSADGRFTVVYFDAGRAVFADSPAVSQTLGRLLLEEGVITHQQYTMAIGELRRTLATDRNARLGGVLVSLGFTTVDEVQDALFKQMARRVSDLMDNSNPTWTWAAGEAQLAKVPRYPMRVEPLVFDGIRRFYDQARMSQALAPYRGGFLVLRAPLELIERCFSLTPAQSAMIGTIDGKDVTEVWLMRQESEDAWPLVTALAMTGVLAVLPGAPSLAAVEAEANKNPSLAPPGNTGIFEVPAVHVMPAVAVPSFGTDRAPATKPSPPPSREQLARLEAESACRIGIDLLHAEEFSEAEKQFRIATRAMPKVSEYQLYWTWCCAKMKPRLDTGTVGELEELAKVTARQDSRHAMPPYVSAYVALERDDENTALRYFKVAFHREPANKDAGNQMRRLSRTKRR